MARLVSWLLDALVLFLIVRTFMRAIGGGGAARKSRPTTSAPTPERSGGTLVRDPQCGTYVPESSAVRVKAGDKTLYFCSTACRDAYQTRT